MYAEYFLKQYKGKEVVEFIDTEGKSSFGEIEKIDFSKAQKDLIKEFNVALYPENVNKTNAVLITANGKPILIEEGAKTSEEIDEKQQGHPFQTMYHVSSAEAAKKLNLETFAAIYALELWVKKNNIKIEGEYQKKLDDLLASYKPAAIDQCFDIYFNSPSRMDDLKKEVKARENIDYFEKLKKYIATEADSLREDFKSRGKVPYDELSYYDRLKEIIEKFFHPKK